MALNNTEKATVGGLVALSAAAGLFVLSSNKPRPAPDASVIEQRAGEAHRLSHEERLGLLSTKKGSRPDAGDHEQRLMALHREHERLGFKPRKATTQEEQETRIKTLRDQK